MSESNGHVTEDQPATISTKNRVAEYFATNPAAKLKDAAAALGVSVATITNNKKSLGLSVPREPRVEKGKKTNTTTAKPAKAPKSSPVASNHAAPTETLAFVLKHGSAAKAVAAINSLVSSISGK